MTPVTAFERPYDQNVDSMLAFCCKYPTLGFAGAADNDIE